MQTSTIASTHYNDQFFLDLSEGSRQSAQILLPHVLSLIRCHSVLDVGCGTGEWLRAVKQLGINDVLGLDGDYVRRDQLQIAPEEFQAVDLANPPTLPRRFDLAISLEVAEHLPPDSADRFVAFLISTAPVVLFSAAIPEQGGTDHVNEQWPDYWAAKFAQHDFVTVDCIRDKIWSENRVMWWYQQNSLLFVRKDIVEGTPAIADSARQTNPRQLALIHPSAFAASRKNSRELLAVTRRLEDKLKPENMPFLKTLLSLPAIMMGAVKRKLKAFDASNH